MPNKKKQKKNGETTAVQKKQESKVSIIKERGRGFEQSDSQDYIIPRIKLLQALSPELENDDDLKAGMFVNSLTSEKIEKPAKFVPIWFSKSRIKFIPREDGGGIDCRSLDGVRPHTGKMYQSFCKNCPYSEWNDLDGKRIAPACNLFFNFIGFLPDMEGEANFITASFVKTSFKAGQQLLSIARFRGNDIFMYCYYLDSKKVSNDKGTFYIYTVKPGERVDEATFQIAEQYYEAIQTMQYDIDVYDQEDEFEPKEEDQTGNVPF